MKRVEFITIEDETDLIVSFAIAPSANQSLTLLRSPQHEVLFPDYERCAYVSLDPTSEPADDPLLSVHWKQSKVTVTTCRHVYELDISVDEIEITKAKTVVKKW